MNGSFVAPWKQTQLYFGTSVQGLEVMGFSAFSFLALVCLDCVFYVLGFMCFSPSSGLLLYYTVASLAYFPAGK